MTRRARPYPAAIAAVIDGWDGGDPYGSAVSLAFAVCDVAYALDHREPLVILDYRPAAGQSVVLADLVDNADGDVNWETETLAIAVRDGEVSEDDLTHAARCLSRYLRWCELAGLDY